MHDGIVAIGGLVPCQGANTDASQKGNQDWPQGGGKQPAAAGAQAAQPKRSHHVRYGRLSVPLPDDWEQFAKNSGGLHGIRRRAPKSVTEAAKKTKGGRSAKIEWRFTPKDEAMNIEFCKRHNIQQVEIQERRNGSPPRGVARLAPAHPAAARHLPRATLTVPPPLASRAPVRARRRPPGHRQVRLPRPRHDGRHAQQRIRPLHGR